VWLVVGVAVLGALVVAGYVVFSGRYFTDLRVHPMSRAAARDCEARWDRSGRAGFANPAFDRLYDAVYVSEHDGRCAYFMMGAPGGAANHQVREQQDGTLRQYATFFGPVPDDGHAYQRRRPHHGLI
jgi:hypothetical protein